MRGDEEELAKLSKAHLADHARLKEVEAELETVSSALRGADDSRRLTDKELQVKDTIAELRRNFPGQCPLVWRGGGVW